MKYETTWIDVFDTYLQYICSCYKKFKLWITLLQIDFDFMIVKGKGSKKTDKSFFFYLLREEILRISFYKGVCVHM